MDLSIVIVNYNHPKLIQKCLESIKRSKPSMSYEIIVVDNNSTYDVKAQMDAFQSGGLPIRLIQNKENAGFGKANNQGVEQANGDYVLFLNTDIEVIGNAIDELYSFIETQDHSVIAGGKLFNTDLSDQPSAGPFFTLWNTFVMLFLFGDRLGFTRYSPLQTKVVGWLAGACFLMKRSDFIKVDGFDESIFMYMEEVDLMYRAAQQNIKTIFYHDAHFIHVGAATSSSRTRPVINIYKGLLFFYKKHNPQYLPILRVMLATKARVSYILGRLAGNTYLSVTYEKALRIVQE